MNIMNSTEVACKKHLMRPKESIKIRPNEPLRIRCPYTTVANTADQQSTDTADVPGDPDVASCLSPRSPSRGSSISSHYRPKTPCSWSSCGSRHRGGRVQSSPDPTRYSIPPSRPSDKWNSDAAGGKFLTSSIYLAIFLCILGGACFLMLRMKSDAESCKICDEKVLPEQHTAQTKRSPEYSKADYASDEHGAYIELHDTYAYLNKESFVPSDLLRLPSVDKMAPDTILKDNEECFAMQGHTGTFIIHLSRPIVVQAVTLVHNREECDTAPKDFIIYGIKDPKEKVQVHLGQFQYENRGKAAQKFVIPRFDEIKYIGFKIVSNWGNPRYTCIYKIKVHGEPEDW